MSSTKVKNKILILVPAVTARGGISNYYQVLKKEFPDNIEYLERGARSWPHRKGFLQELCRAWNDYRIFKGRLRQKDIALVQTTTSLSLQTTIRDGLFVRYAYKHGIKSVVFFRGWDESAAERIQKKYLAIFKYFFFVADRFIVLSAKTKKDLRKWGYRKKIHVETTLVDKSLLMDVNETSIRDKFNGLNEAPLNLLFLSRIERRKGIYELLKAFKNIQVSKDNQNKLYINICGDGSEEERVRQWIDVEGLTNIRYSGFVSGLEKKQVFESAHAFVFPSYGEGMPNAVLEAMGFGLPVITTPVGGVVDFFQPGQNGYFVTVQDASDLEEKLKMLNFYRKNLLSMALNNYCLASATFTSDNVAKRIEKIFMETIGA